MTPSSLGYAALLAVTLPAATIRRLDGSRIPVAHADSIARALVARHRITGMQLAVVNDGKRVWSAAYGLRHKAPDLAMERTSITWAASITKGVFATYVMQLVEQGRFDLDQPVATLLARPLDQYEEYTDQASLLVSDSAWSRVTPRMLLSHTSGLPNFAFVEPDGKLRLHDRPGGAYRYSGVGLNILQQVLEERFGTPLTTQMDSALFGPLALTRTAMAFRKEFEPDMADRFGSDEQFLSATRRNARAAGSLTTSAEDLAAFAIALMDGRILSPASRAELLRPQVSIRTQHQFPRPGDSGESEEAARVGLAYGLGWGLLTTTPFGPAFFKEGHGDGAQTYMICFERRKDCMIILTNSDNGERAFRTLLEEIMGNTVVPWEWEGYTEAALRGE